MSSWRRKRDKDKERWRNMFPWLPFELFESSGFFAEDFLDQLMDEMERILGDLESTDPNVLRKKFGPFVWGWNVTIGPDGKPTFKEFGNVRPSYKGKPLPSKDREPLVDVFIEDKFVRLIAEIPGVSRDDIKVKATEKKIMLSARSGDRNYSTERELTVEVKPETATAVYKNGILEIKVERKEPSKEEGFDIKIV